VRRHWHCGSELSAGCVVECRRPGPGGRGCSDPARGSRGVEGRRARATRRRWRPPPCVQCVPFVACDKPILGRMSFGCDSDPASDARALRDSDSVLH
jgi:hypothetical protein